MLTKSKVAFSAALILAVSSVALAKDDSVPNIDLRNLCRSNQRAIDAALGAGNISMVDSCIGGEQGARAQLVKDWATFSASDKTLCMRPTVYLPSYVEWLTCFEMNKSVREARQQGRSTGAMSNADGSITLPPLRSLGKNNHCWRRSVGRKCSRYQ